MKSLSSECEQDDHLYVGLHGLSRGDEVVVAAVDLELPPRSGGVRNTGSELFRIFRDQLVVDAILEGTQDDDGSGN
jgi:hypothetical protein